MRQKSRLKAIFLAFFTGFVGGHKFYLGKVGGFIGYMILFIVSINVFRSPILSFVAGIIDAIKLINMSDENFDAKYNGGASSERIPQAQTQQRRGTGGRTVQSTRTTTPSRKSPINSSKANSLKNSGIKKYKEFDLEGAIDDFSEALRVAPGDVALHFNLACAYSLTEQKGKAYYHISQAVSLGLQDVQKILTHDDLAFVRIQPEFDNFRASGFMDFNLAQAHQKKDGHEINTDKKTVIHDPSGEPHIQVQDDALLSQLNKLAELRQKGILSEDEFQFERKKILRQ